MNTITTSLLILLCLPLWSQRGTDLKMSEAFDRDYSYPTLIYDDNQQPLLLMINTTGKEFEAITMSLDNSGFGKIKPFDLGRYYTDLTTKRAELSVLTVGKQSVILRASKPDKKSSHLEIKGITNPQLSFSQSTQGDYFTSLTAYPTARPEALVSRDSQQAAIFWGYFEDENSYFSIIKFNNEGTEVDFTEIPLRSNVGRGAAYYDPVITNNGEIILAFHIGPQRKAENWETKGLIWIDQDGDMQSISWKLSEEIYDLNDFMLTDSEEGVALACLFYTGFSTIGGVYLAILNDEDQEIDESIAIPLAPGYLQEELDHVPAEIFEVDQYPEPYDFFSIGDKLIYIIEETAGYYGKAIGVYIFEDTELENYTGFGRNLALNNYEGEVSPDMVIDGDRLHFFSNDREENLRERLEAESQMASTLGGHYTIMQSTVELDDPEKFDKKLVMGEELKPWRLIGSQGIRQGNYVYLTIGEKAGKTRSKSYKVIRYRY